MSNSSLWPKDKTLSGAFTPDQSGPESDGNKEVVRIPSKFQHYWSLTIRLFSFISRTLVGGVLTLCRDVVGVFYSPNSLGLTTLELSFEKTTSHPVKITCSWKKKHLANFDKFKENELAELEYLYNSVKTQKNIYVYVSTLSHIYLTQMASRFWRETRKQLMLSSWLSSRIRYWMFCSRFQQI